MPMTTKESCMPMKKNHFHTSRRIPDNWQELHDRGCTGECANLGEEPEEEPECSVWQYTHFKEWGWNGSRPPMLIDPEGNFFDRYGQVCLVAPVVIEGRQLLSLGVTEALTPPDWDGHTRLGNYLFPSEDLMILDPEGALTLASDLRVFQQTGYVPPQKHTERGFGLGTFKDAREQECSLQDSSLATEAAIWLGVDVNQAGQRVSNRMHLTTDMVEALVPLLETFFRMET